MRFQEQNNLIHEILKGNFRAASELMRDIENSDHRVEEYIRQLFPHTGKAHIIGITGFPGTGKSSLIDGLIPYFRKNHQTVGVIAIDPSSPITGGAILGDRIRMQRHACDKGVFIRSMATRGNLGGLSKNVWQVITIMDAMGMNVILVETVGVGQAEFDIRWLVHTNIVVMVPGFGDGIQAMKAGIVEIAHILVINKIDQFMLDPMVDRVFSEHTLASHHSWKSPMIKTSAVQHIGIDKLFDEIHHHRKYLKDSSDKTHVFHPLEQIFFNLLKDKLFDHIVNQIRHQSIMEQTLACLHQREIDPYTASDRIVADVMNHLSF